MFGINSPVTLPSANNNHPPTQGYSQAPSGTTLTPDVNQAMRRNAGMTSQPSQLHSSVTGTDPSVLQYQARLHHLQQQHAQQLQIQQAQQQHLQQQEHQMQPHAPPHLILAPQHMASPNTRQNVVPQLVNQIQISSLVQQTQLQQQRSQLQSQRPQQHLLFLQQQQQEQMHHPQMFQQQLQFQPNFSDQQLDRLGQNLALPFKAGQQDHLQALSGQVTDAGTNGGLQQLTAYQQAQLNQQQQQRRNEVQHLQQHEAQSGQPEHQLHAHEQVQGQEQAKDPQQERIQTHNGIELHDNQTQGQDRERQQAQQTEYQQQNQYQHQRQQQHEQQQSLQQKQDHEHQLSLPPSQLQQNLHQQQALGAMCSPMQRNVIQSALQAPSSLDPIITDERSSRALLRLMEFGRAIGLNIEHQTIDFWQAFVAKFFGNAGKLRYKLVNPVTSESKVFELTAPSLPRFYLGTVESGIKQLQLILEQALGQTAPFPLIVECPRITLVSHHINGSKIFAKGTIKATFATDFKFDLLELTSLGFEEFISRPVDETLGSPLLESKIEGKKKGNMKRALTTSKKATQSIPESIVNEFGITHKAMRLLELSDVCSKMTELIQHSAYTRRGPAETLAMYSQLLRDNKQVLLRAGQTSAQSNSPNLTNSFATPVLSHIPTLLTHQSGASSTGIISSQTHSRASASPRSMKRRTSVAMSPCESSHVSSPSASPAVEDTQGHGVVNASTPSIKHAIINNMASGPTSNQTAGTGLGLRLVGSPLQTPSSSITSPVFSPVVTGNILTATGMSPVKPTKRARTASMTPTLTTAGAAAQKGSTGGAIGGNSGSVNGTTVGRNRKNTGRKDSGTKRKASMTEELRTDVRALAAGPLEPSAHATGPLEVGSQAALSAGMMMLMSSNHPLPGPSHGSLAADQGLGQAQGSHGMHLFMNATTLPMMALGKHQDTGTYVPGTALQQASMLGMQNGLDNMRSTIMGVEYTGTDQEGPSSTQGLLTIHDQNQSIAPARP